MKNVCPAVKILNTVSVDKQGKLISEEDGQIKNDAEQQSQSDIIQKETTSKIINTNPQDFLATLSKNSNTNIETSDIIEKDNVLIEDDISKIFEMKKQSLQNFCESNQTTSENPYENSLANRIDNNVEENKQEIHEVKNKNPEIEN